MNRKQLITLWVVAILMCVALLATPKKYMRAVVAHGYLGRYGDYKTYGDIPVPTWEYTILACSTILIIGALLVYILKDKKEMSILKRSIVREALLLLVLICGIVFLFLSNHYYHAWVTEKSVFVPLLLSDVKYPPVKYLENKFHFFRNAGIILTIAYLGTMYIRLILWLVRTWKEK